MAGVVRQVRVPKELRPWITRLDLLGWVGRRDWDKEPRFTVIERARQSWVTMGHLDFADDPDSIVKVAYLYFEEDLEFIDYVTDECDQDITDRADWVDVIKTYTWVVLQRYNREIGAGGDDD